MRPRAAAYAGPSANARTPRVRTPTKRSGIGAMNAVPSELIQKAEQLSADVTRPIPGSHKIHVEGSRPDIRVPMREIVLARTPTMFGGEDNAPLAVYDTSGAYTDANAQIDLARGLAPLRAQWIAERGDTEVLPGLVLGVRPQARDTTRSWTPCASASRPLPRRAKSGANVTQMHYARRGIVTPGDGVRRHPREPARWTRSAMAHLLRQHAGRDLRRQHPEAHHAGIRARRSGARPRHHPQQHQPPGKRADDHRPQLPDQDQRQHRQLGACQLGHRRGSGEAGVVDPLGRATR